MSRTQVSEVLNIVSQIVPFLIITIMLVTISYSYAHSVKSCDCGAVVGMSYLL